MALKRYIVDKRIFVEKTNKTVVGIENQLDLYKYISDVAALVVTSGVTASSGLTETGGNLTLGGTLTSNTTIAGSTFDFAVNGTGNKSTITVDPLDAGLYNTVTTTTTGVELASTDTTNGLASSVRTISTGVAVMEATDGIITSGVAVTNAYAQLGSNGSTVTANILAEISSGIAMTYDDGSSTVSVAVVVDAGDALPGIKLLGLSVYANEAAAVIGGLTTGSLYQTVTGEVRIKL